MYNVNISDKITGVYGTSSDYRFDPKTRELDVEFITGRTLSVDANNHATLYRMQFSSPNDGIPIEVMVGEGTATDSGLPLVSPGSCIIFTQESTNNLTFVPKPDITIKCAGQLKAWGKNSTVTLISLDTNTWMLGGDILPDEVTVDG